MRNARQHFMLGLIKLKLSHWFDDLPGVYIGSAGEFVRIDPLDFYLEPKKVFNDSTDPGAIAFAEECLKTIRRELFRLKMAK